MLNLESTISCGIWTPDDQQVYFGTTSGQIIVMDVHGAMVSQIQISADIGISSMAWSCEKFKMEETDDNDATVTNNGREVYFTFAVHLNTVTFSLDEKKFVLAVCLQNGYIHLLKTFDDVSPIQVNTYLHGTLCMEWSNSRELLAVAGLQMESKHVGTQPEFINMLKFYSEKGILIYTIKIPYTQVTKNYLFFNTF